MIDFKVKVLVAPGVTREATDAEEAQLQRTVGALRTACDAVDLFGEDDLERFAQEQRDRDETA